MDTTAHAMTTEEHAAEAVRLLRKGIHDGGITPMGALTILHEAHEANKAAHLAVECSTRTQRGIEQCNNALLADGREQVVALVATA